MTTINEHYTQTPTPGDQRVLVAGDTLTVTLVLPDTAEGDAWLRTNIGLAAIRRREVIQHVRHNTAILARDWHDLPMRRVAPDTFRLDVPLAQPGHYEAKTLFLPENAGEPVWPPGPNLHIKVAPAHTVAANTIYTAFVRQFRDGKQPDSVPDSTISALDADGYTVIPRSGKLRNLARQLDVIIGQMGFRIIQLLPIFPTPTTYARMGRYGSPFASLDFMAVDPSLAEFDRCTTPLDQFLELVDAVHARHAHLYLDVPINHTGWASWLQLHHPDWFVRDDHNHFQSPGAWGTTWEDLSELDYNHRPLWEYMADMFLFWCRQGVDGFRCDAGYMVPLAVWEFISARVRTVFPDTVFLLEGLGGKIEVMEALLLRGGLDWAYSEIFQTLDRHALEHYIPACAAASDTKGLLIHFAETHDNNRLAAVSPEHARMRTALSALASTAGGFGITNGVEWFATEKVDVHGAAPMEWGAQHNQLDAIRRLNAVLRAHPAFRHGAHVEVIPQHETNAIVLRRTSPDGKSSVRVCINLDPRTPTSVYWPADETTNVLVDLLSGESQDMARDGETCRITLAPAHALCLTTRIEELSLVTTEEHAPTSERAHQVEHQRLRAKALALAEHYAQPVRQATITPNINAWVQSLASNPESLCAQLSGATPGVTCWRWPVDMNRIVMIQPGHALLMRAPHPFQATLIARNEPVAHEASLCDATGSHFVLFLPRPTPAQHTRATLEVVVHGNGTSNRATAPLLFLTEWDRINCPQSCTNTNLLSDEYCGLATNGRGAMLLANAMWARLWSQYDALLAANLHPTVPVDRQVLFTRCRGWVVHQGYSAELGPECLVTFRKLTGNGLLWSFTVPVGCGACIRLDVTAHLMRDANRTLLRFHRRPAAQATSELADDKPVELILRPDIEDRNFHDVTKAYLGAETHFRRAVHANEHGFCFDPAGTHSLTIEMTAGAFHANQEWSYQVPHPYEQERGLEGSGDLFSPGYFTCYLKGSDNAILSAEARRDNEPTSDITSQAASEAPQATRLLDILRDAMADFIVRRDDSLTVIAGYPWFLDWGRDTLICLRGIIAAGYRDEACEVLTQFARFERDGTLPNMIRGNDDANRETSDAPLWFFVACADVIDADRGDAFLETDCGGRTVRDVLHAIADGYTRGTPNGIRLDPQSGLVFSPSHYTWMDTNHPAGTPREGYPIEIQALWFAAQRLLARIDPAGTWAARAQLTADSIQAYFAAPDRGFLSDCLHAPAGTPAQRAEPDDALRSNQLLAVTLGAVTDKTECAAILRACEELLVPGAIRSLADRPVRYEIPVNWQDQRLNDPTRPYWGHYSGDEDTRRKPAYHNGTAWTWPFPSYAEALVMTHGEPARASALALLGSSSILLNTGCIGQIPEIVDGDAPHRQKGCGAQAWGVTELYRVAATLSLT